MDDVKDMEYTYVGGAMIWKSKLERRERAMIEWRRDTPIADKADVYCWHHGSESG